MVNNSVNINKTVRHKNVAGLNHLMEFQFSLSDNWISSDNTVYLIFCYNSNEGPS